MQTQASHLIQARALLADIEAASGAYIPRREVLTDWLRGFLARAQAANYHVSEREVDDLMALEHFLRTIKVPLTGHARV